MLGFVSAEKAVHTDILVILPMIAVLPVFEIVNY